MGESLLARLTAILLLALPALAVGGAPGYDPLALAVDALSQMGMPPPPGYVIREARTGELGGVPARVDHDEPAIIVDVAGAIDALAANGSAGPSALVALLMMFLWHEYHHCDGYDLPGHPAEPSRYNDLCGHFDLGGASIDFLCERICSETDPDAKAALCVTHNSLTDNYNAGLVVRNRRCSPALGRKFLCPCCGNQA